MSREAALALLCVSRETMHRLDAYVACLTRWNRRINLVGRATLAEVWTRHILDSAQLLPLAPPGARHWADLGSGGGFPGLAIAILAAEKAPGLVVTLVESDLRKAAFLGEAARAAGVGVTILPDRAETVRPIGADIVSARALAPLSDLLGLVARHLAPGGRALLPKGTEAGHEVAAALERWHFTVQRYPSRTNPGAVILEIGEIARA